LLLVGAILLQCAVVASDGEEPVQTNSMPNMEGLLFRWSNGAGTNETCATDQTGWYHLLIVDGKPAGNRKRSYWKYEGREGSVATGCTIRSSYRWQVVFNDFTNSPAGVLRVQVETEDYGTNRHYITYDLTNGVCHGKCVEWNSYRYGEWHCQESSYVDGFRNGTQRVWSVDPGSTGYWTRTFVTNDTVFMKELIRGNPDINNRPNDVIQF
jgi:hypothetical protein